MASDVQRFTVTCPAGVAIAGPQVFPLVMPPRVVRRIDWTVPNGPLLLMGFLLSMGGVPVLPVAGQFTYVVENASSGFWELEGYPDSGAWQATMYNTGSVPHSVRLTFAVDLPARPRQAAPLHDFTAPPFTADLSAAGPPVPQRI